MHQARDQNLIHKKLLAFLDSEGDVYTVRSSSHRLSRDFQTRIGETIVEVIVEDFVARIDQVVIRIRLS